MDKLIYHYTSFEKLQCILKYGTLRFKESTSSNDILVLGAGENSQIWSVKNSQI